MKKVLLYSSEPGGVELLKALQSLVADNLEMVFVSSGVGAQRLENNRHPFKKIDSTESQFKNIIDELSPDFVVTSATSIAAQNPGEATLWRVCETFGIKTIGFLDQWQNYRIRFSTDGKNLDVMPTYINAIDEIGKYEMLESGFEEKKLLCFGQPYLETFVDSFKNKLKAKPSGPPYRLFVSEPIQEFYQMTRGYDQFLAYDFLLKTLRRAQPSGPLKMYLKLHPKEKKASEMETISRKHGVEVEIYGPEILPESVIGLADEVYGMTSIMLVQAYFLGIPVTSIQPNLQVEDPLVISRHGLIKRLGSETQEVKKNDRFNKLDYLFKKQEFIKFLMELT